MFLVYNNLLTEETGFALPPDNRALTYGDGFFETIRYQNGHLWFWPDHADRISDSLTTLYLTEPIDFAETVLYQISKLLTVNKLLVSTARIKLQVWRKPGGLYTPTGVGIDWLLTARSGPDFVIGEKARVGISETVRLVYWQASAIKTLSALPYVLAGQERQERGLDELILLENGPAGNLAECSAANLFWFEAGTLHTPDLKTGCVSGIVHRRLLRLAKESGITVKTGFFPKAVLTRAEAVFCTNVNGIHYLRNIQDTGSFPAKHPVADSFFKALLAETQPSN
jgi:4-amino-4-deoxychorismate lyase